VFELYRDLTPTGELNGRLNDFRFQLDRHQPKIERTRFSVNFIGGNVVSPVGQNESSSTFNYFCNCLAC
jgi:hypothetical protein